MDNKLIILITTLLAGCATQAPSNTPDLAVEPDAYQGQEATILEPEMTDVSYNPAPVDESQSNANVAEVEKPMVLAASPFTVSTVTPALYSVNRGNNLKIDSHTSAGNPSSYRLLGIKYNILPFSKGYVKQGIASWYGSDFHGKKTSNGEIYNMHGMTAAHKTLPIPSYVKVTNLKNNRSVVLRINDRGPYHNNRIIDLSYAAAQKLGVYQPGTEQVHVQAIKTNSHVFLQLGVFDNPNNARKLQQKVVSSALPQPKIKQVIHQGRVVYKVQIGPLDNNAQVKNLNLQLAKIGISKTRYVTVR